MRPVGRSVDDIHTNRVGIDLANTWLAALAPITIPAIESVLLIQSVEATAKPTTPHSISLHLKFYCALQMGYKVLIYSVSYPDRVC